MGTQTMGTSGGTEKMDGLLLSRQGSLYNLTLDEVQQQLGDLGKPFSSMNLDELLKTVYNVEANHGVSSNKPDQMEHPQRGSVSSMELRKKTVDEVWHEIQLGQIKKKNEGSDDGGNNNNVDNNVSNGSSCKNGDRKRQPTFGEMTLEDFLVKAGVVSESSCEKELSVDIQEAPWVNYWMPIVQQQGLVMGGHFEVQQPVLGAGNALMDVGYMSPTPLMGCLPGAHMSGRKRYASGEVVEKTVERRQKRMIKNRESAARSRARKQAYTHELENKISCLEEENERLRRQKELEKVLPCVPPPEPKCQLRRTTSASF